MARTHSEAPPALRKTSDGHAAVTLFDVVTGHRKEFRLGRHGTKESRRQYDRVVPEWLARGRRLSSPRSIPSDLTVVEALDRWPTEMSRRCRRPDGSPTMTISGVAVTAKYLQTMFGVLPLGEFAAEHLEAFRDKMITDGRVVPQINKRLSQVRQFLNWCIGQDLVPVTVDVGRLLLKLKRVKAVRPGEFGARPGKIVLPANPAHVDKALTFMSPVAAAVLKLLRASGARPSEIG